MNTGWWILIGYAVIAFLAMFGMLVFEYVEAEGQEGWWEDWGPVPFFIGIFWPAALPVLGAMQGIKSCGDWIIAMKKKRAESKKEWEREVRDALEVQ